MSETSQNAQLPNVPSTDIWGGLRAVRRGLPLGLLIVGCLLILLLVRLIERPIWGQRRSWLDIFALNARKRIYFVSKSEVAGWPAIGWLARATGTVFIKRDRREASSQIKIFRNRLAVGHKLLFFPEGTSTDGQQVLPFKPTLFAAFFDPALIDTLQLQPVSLTYTAPEAQDPRFYGWWGDMALAPHLFATLSAKRQGQVTVVYHTPVAVRDFTDRKTLARQMEALVRSGLTDHSLVKTS